MINFSDE